MTDAEIIKALEYCVNHKECADACPCIIAEKPCVLNTPIKLLNLINRQQEVIKDFADALKSKSELVAPSVWAEPYRAVSVDDIDNLVKIIAGGDENESKHC